MAPQQSQPNPSDSYRPSLYAAAIITWTLALSAVILRFTARRLTHLNLWYDDWLVVVALLAVTAFFVDSLIWIHLGLGVHYQTLTDSYDTIVRNTLLNLFVEEIFYCTATAFCKLSLLAFYWRIFKVPSIRWPVRVLAAAVLCWLVARYIATVLHCIPVRAYWDKSVKNATCGVNDRLFFIGTNTVNVIMDLAIFVLPMPYVKKLQVQRAQKLVVFGMFTLGAFIVVVSIILLVVCYKLDNKSPDVSWTISPIVLWAGTEINLGVVTACLPSLRPIFLLITKGSATPNQTKNSKQFGNSGGLGSKAVATFGSGSRNVKPVSGIEDDDLHHPFSVIQDDSNIVDPHYNAENQSDQNSNIDLLELQPPEDKVMVRNDIFVKYSNV